MKKIFIFLLGILLLGSISYGAITGGPGRTSNDSRYVNVTGDTMTGILTMSATIEPGTTNTYELGTSSLEWKNLHVSGQGNFGSMQIVGTAIQNAGAGGVIDINAGIDLRPNVSNKFVGINGNLSMEAGTIEGTSTSTSLDIAPLSSMLKVIGTIEPSADDTYDFGTTSLEWKDIYSDGTIYSDHISISGDIDMTGVTEVTNGNNWLILRGFSGVKLLDRYSNEFLVATTTVTNAVDYIGIENGTGAVTLEAAGDSTDVDLNINAKGSGNVYISGNLNLDSNASFNGGAVIVGNQQLGIGGAAASDTLLEGDTAADQILLALGANQGNQFVVTTRANLARDHDHAAGTNPPIYIHSACDPDINNTRWGSVSHSGTSTEAGTFEVATGSGDIKLSPAGKLVIAATIEGTSNGTSLDIVPTTGDYLRVGDAGATSQSLNTNDDLFVSGKLEVDSSLYADGGIVMPAGVGIYQSATLVGSLFMNNSVQTPDVIHLLTGTSSNIFLISEYADRNTDYGHALQTNPTIFIQSSNEADVAEWISLCHDQTNAEIKSGQGGIDMEPATTADPVTIKSLLLISPEATCPVSSSTAEGTIWWNATTHTPEAWDGSVWQPFW